MMFSTGERATTLAFTLRWMWLLYFLLIGVLKYCKYADDVADGAKDLGKVIEAAGDVGKYSDDIVDAVDNAKDIGKAVDVAADVGKIFGYCCRCG